MVDAMKPSQALRKARDLITPEGAWIKGESAKTELGDALDHGFFAGACCWCAIGAIENVEGKEWWYCNSFPFLNLAMYGDIAAVNDSTNTSQDTVLAYYERAIALAEADGL